MLPGTTGMHYCMKSAEQLQLHESDHESAFVLKKKNKQWMDQWMDQWMPMSLWQMVTFQPF